MAAPSLTIDRNEQPLTVSAAGDWLLLHVERIEALLDSIRSEQGGVIERLKLAELNRLDTTGGYLLLQLLGKPEPDQLSDKLVDANDQHRMILSALAQKIREAETTTGLRDHGIHALLLRTGKWMVEAWRQVLLLTHFVGVVIATTMQNLVQPWRMRWTSLFYHMEHIGLDAVPIVSLLSFLVGSTVAFLGSSILRDFGATLYTPDMVGFAFLREFGALLPAILLAGRSGSAFTAQLGSMKSNEEIDALKTMGMDPVCILVMPRVVALIVVMPLLSFIAMLSGLIGGMVVSSLVLDISPGAYINRIYNFTSITHFWAGICKTPVFAFLIGVVGCLEGFKVSGSAESVGRHTTSSVVQSIFLVLVADTMFAVLFEQLDI